MSPARLRLLSLIGVGAVLVLLVVLVVLARLDIKPAPTASAEVPALLAVGTELQKPRPVSSVPLIDAHGKPFSLTQWRGKWVILAPSMTLCHEVCPMTTGALMELSTTCASPACPSGWSSPRRPSIRGATARSGCARIRS